MTGTGRQWDWSAAGWQVSWIESKPSTGASTNRPLSLSKDGSSVKTQQGEKK